MNISLILLVFLYAHNVGSQTCSEKAILTDLNQRTSSAAHQINKFIRRFKIIVNSKKSKSCNIEICRYTSKAQMWIGRLHPSRKNMVEILAISIYVLEQFERTMIQVVNRENTIHGRRSYVVDVKAIQSHLVKDVDEFKLYKQRLENIPCDHEKSKIVFNETLAPLVYPDPNPSTCVCRSVSIDHQLYNILSDISSMYMVFVTYYRCLLMKINNPGSVNPFLCASLYKMNWVIQD